MQQIRETQNRIGVLNRGLTAQIDEVRLLENQRISRLEGRVESVCACIRSVQEDVVQLKCEPRKKKKKKRKVVTSTAKPGQEPEPPPYEPWIIPNSELGVQFETYQQATVGPRLETVEVRSLTNPRYVFNARI